ncbi:MAG: ribonuclease III [Candidatus Andersenbacteria bacterium]|nr:ribonuclease III [bacterium]MDZ4225854.1 ribonuclease III [Candidatus Andersenbacteria bacterium]
MPDLSELEKTLGVEFKNKDLVETALTHRSYLNENPRFNLPHNERLEFLGDAVLELIVTDHLYHHYNLPEGELTNLRAAVVRGEMLSVVAEELGLDDFLLLSRGEKKDTGKARQYIWANAVEAVIGAIYLDAGYEAAAGFIERNIIKRLPEVIEQGLHIDSKSKFQELAQEKYRATPSYKVLSEEGLDHAKQFVVGVFVGKEQMGEGKGTSKQEAQQNAAKEALEKIQ